MSITSEKIEGDRISLNDLVFPLPIGKFFDDSVRHRLKNSGLDLYVLNPRSLGIKGIDRVYKQLDEKVQKVKGIIFIVRE